MCVCVNINFFLGGGRVGGGKGGNYLLLSDQVAVLLLIYGVCAKIYLVKG